MQNNSDPWPVASISVWQEPDGVDGRTVHVSMNTQSGTEWIGTEEEFRKLFCAGVDARKSDLNDMGLLLGELWASAQAKQLGSARSNTSHFSQLRSNLI